MTRSFITVGFGIIFVCAVSCSATLNSTSTHHVTFMEPDATWQDHTTEWHWDWRNQLGIVISGLVAMLTAPGGGSGATLYMPLFNLLIGFDARQTAVITNFVVFLGAITSTIYALAEPHPITPTRPRIDWCSVLVMTPPLMLGVSFGVIMNSVLPIWLLQSATLTAFLWSLSKTIRSFLKINKVENKAAKSKNAPQTRDVAAVALAEALLPMVQEGNPPASAYNTPQLQAPQTTSYTRLPESGVTCKQSRLRSVVAASRTWLSAWWSVQPAIVQALVLLVMVVQVTFAVVSHETAEKCSRLFWILLAGNAALVLLFTWQAVATTRWYSQRWARQQLTHALQPTRSNLLVEVVVDDMEPTDIDVGMDITRKHSIVIVNPHVADSLTVSLLPQSPGPTEAAAAAPATAAAKEYGPSWEAIQWDGSKLAYVPLLMVAVGIVSGCLGLGGGFLVTPMLLGMGLHPQCQAVTSRVILFISTFATSFCYLIGGRVPLYYGLVHGGINLVLSPVGIWTMDRVIEKSGKPSLMVLLNIGRYVVGMSLLLFLSAIPAYIATAKGEFPVGLAMQNLCGPAAL